ncbi:DUF4317 domain-containing protein [[Clostridium] polysaccharolyticum]|uniref:DUF4317 domain-containing protein n=1 Tax=[Clostridium] polysaccharolyticum TaxID=29364 RepID=A0A1I0EIQ7_9FIRM|nr:DUF4317 domain-containing protein [[Clostridium] polysaccharolyticum]SET44344.1 protein of unknown function [[Clostridium] polysaccharolyticum]
MTKKDVLELKRRFKKNECTFTRLSGCYVNGEKEIVLNIGETFLNLEEEEFYKYLEIAKKTLSGTVGNNLLELNFPLTEEAPGGKQQFLMGLRESALKNDALLESFYHHVIDTYDYAGNYLILIFHDAYDVMAKTSDNNKLEESEEVYEYLLCAICPVTLSKPGLGYLEAENRIGPRIRDWVVGIPENGFVFPSFSDRSSDIHSIIYYTKNAKEPHPEFMEFGLGCDPKPTATEQKETFKSIITHAIAPIEQEEGHYFMEIQESLNSLVEEQEAFENNQNEPLLLTNNNIQEVLAESGIPEEITSEIKRSYTEEFGDTPPAVEHLLDTKALAANVHRKREKELTAQVQVLQQKLEETQQDMEQNTAALEELSEDYTIILNVSPQKAGQISSQIINGKRCLVIPMEENEHATVNGVDTPL